MTAVMDIHGGGHDLRSHAGNTVHLRVFSGGRSIPPLQKGSPVPSPHTDPDIVLHERWFPNPLWMKVILGLTALIGCLMLFLVLGEAAEDGPFTFVAVFLLIVITMIALPLVVARAHVGVRLYSDRMMITFWPIWRRTFPLERVTRVDTSPVSAMGDYMGVGLRKGHDGRTGLLMGSGTGVEVDLADGTKYTVVHPEQEEAEETARLIEEYRAR